MKEGVCQAAVTGTTSEQTAHNMSEKTASIAAASLCGGSGCNAASSPGPGSKYSGRAVRVLSRRRAQAFQGQRPKRESGALLSHPDGCFRFSQWCWRKLRATGGLLPPRMSGHQTGQEGRSQQRAQNPGSGQSTPEKTNGGRDRASQQVCAFSECPLNSPPLR